MTGEIYAGQMGVDINFVFEMLTGAADALQSFLAASML
jgi:hypothetical protein